MYTVLLSGGSGKRLWPLSNSLRSKQYIKLLNKEGSDEQCSMVQRVWSQLENAGLADKSIICASKAQVEILHSQLGEINIAVEPARRDTFPAVALSCAYLKSRMGASEDDTVCIIPVDPFTEQLYFETLKKLPNVLDRSNAEVTLMGAKPDYPSSKFGYIVPRESKGDYIEVDSFTEKPDKETAKALIEKGAVWNCGVFCLKIGDILKRCENYGISSDYNEMYHNYDKLPKISFDYEVLEKADRLSAVAFDGMWKDLGTWNSLTEEMHSHAIGRAKIDECENTHVINELDLPVVTMGTKDIVVVASFDGILISDKNSSTRIKDVVAKLDATPRYEERRWGTIKVIDVTEKDGVFNTTRKIKLFAGMNSSYHYHNSRDEVWTVLQGEAELIINGIKQLMGAGQVVRIPAGTKHAVKAITDIEFIEIQFGRSIADDDLNRLTLNWNEIEYI
ncbi:MAG: cupin domain-containing protein [Ruminococcus sp.]|nr:cupin domain-containing protein [Ruminococcus sp.]MBR1824167.1 cupin domain-containing protein [Ruminococcus sp.]